MKSLSIIGLLLFVFSSTELFGQIQVFTGPVAGYHGKAIINQNQYGQRGLDYVYAGDFHYGLALGLDINNKHIFQLEGIITSGGQGYSNSFDGFTLDRNVNISYVQIPLTYRFVTGRNGKDTNKGTNFHILFGGYLGLLQGVEMDQQINGMESNFYDFVTYNLVNRNLMGLNQRIPDRMNPDYNTMFTENDWGGLIGFGMQSFLTTHLKLIVELRAGASLQDINAENWRFLNRNGDYRASRNLFAGLTTGVFYYF